jgi:hypothetical protein
MLLPKIQRKSMLPPRCSRLPWRNIDVRTANHTLFPGKSAGLDGDPASQAVSSPVP